jgi:hypothetical protein
MGNHKSKLRHRQFCVEFELPSMVSWSRAQYEWSA